MGEIFIPGKDIEVNMSLEALHKIAKFVLTNPMKPGDDFTITGTDGKKIILHLK